MFVGLLESPLTGLGQSGNSQNLQGTSVFFCLAENKLNTVCICKSFISAIIEVFH